jgi:hypothetical protein
VNSQVFWRVTCRLSKNDDLRIRNVSIFRENPSKKGICPVRLILKTEALQSFRNAAYYLSIDRAPHVARLKYSLATLVETQTSHVVFCPGNQKVVRSSENHYSSKCNIATSGNFELNGFRVITLSNPLPGNGLSNS